MTQSPQSAAHRLAITIHSTYDVMEVGDEYGELKDRTERVERRRSERAMAMMQTEWNVEHRAGRCAATGRELAEGEEFYTVLFSEGETLRRVDVSVDAWTGPPDNAFCFFRSRVPPKEKRKRLLVDNDVLINFFLRLADETEPARVQFRFVLALILMRKRLLKYESSTTDNGVETWTMTMGKEPVPHRVVNPRLTDDQIAGVSEQLSAILHSDVGDRLASGHAVGDPSESHADA